MASKNDITGDKIQTKGILSKEGKKNWDKIFGKKEFECNTACGHYECMEHQDQCKRLNKSVSRIEQIGQNGNDGIHYEYELDKSTGEIVKVDVKKLTDAFNGH